MELSLVENNNGQLLVSSYAIAEQTNSNHKNVLELISKYSKSFKNQPTFETRPGYNNSQVKVALLDEQQSTFLISLMRNSDIVVSFKAMLVDEFYRMKEALNSAPALPDFSDPKVIAALLTTVQDTQQENKRLNGICNDLASQLSSGITSCQFAKLLNGVNSQQIQSHLIVKGHLKHYAGGELRGIRVVSKGRNTGYYAQKWTTRKDFKVGSAVLTEQGAKWIYSQYHKGNLPMLKNWNGQYSHDLFMSEAPIFNAPALKAVK